MKTMSSDKRLSKITVLLLNINWEVSTSITRGTFVFYISIAFGLFSTVKNREAGIY